MNKSKKKTVIRHIAHTDHLSEQACSRVGSLQVWCSLEMSQSDWIVGWAKGRACWKVLHSDWIVGGAKGGACWKCWTLIGRGQNCPISLLCHPYTV